MEKQTNWFKIIGWCIVVLVVLILLGGSMGTVSTGEVGIKTTLSKVTGTVQPGFYFKMPFFQHVESMDVQTQKEQTDATAASNDLQTVQAKVAINYNIDANKASDLFTRVGTEYKARIIDPAIQEVVKAITAQYTAEQLITKRPEVTDKIQTSLSEKLALNDITVSSVSIINFDFSQSFNTAIEAKVTAEQNALAAKNKLEQVKFEAEQTVATAQAQAEAIKIQAQAINSQGGADYVALQKIKAWDGHACVSYCGLEAMFITK
jgi:regulator of protease activity HflC (stomatin/prohibitin superfamily)